MQTSQPATNLLGLLLMVAAIFPVVKSPKKLQTLGRMLLAFVVTVLLIIVPGAVLRMGDPHAWGRMAALVGFLIAVVEGWWHVRSVRRASTEMSGHSRSKA